MTGRATRPLLWATGVLLGLIGLAACGGSSGGRGAEEYPLVEPPPPPKIVRTVRTPGGAVVSLAALPEAHETAPSATCERVMATFHDGSQPAQRPIIVPPAPGLRAVAVTTRTTRLEWSFAEMPDDCRPVQLTLAVVNASDVGSTPTVRDVEVTAAGGSLEITYPEFLPRPNVAHASAYSADGHRSRTVSVQITRHTSTPPDPPEPLPPVTAPTGQPVTCAATATVVEEPAGDVLTHGVGKPPAQVDRMTQTLSGIDLVKAAVQIDGRTICANLTFGRPPGDADFSAWLHVGDVTNIRCCTSLYFRRTAGRLEFGHHKDGQDGYRLEPVEDAGASLSGATLVLSGTLPDPSEWSRGDRMPAPENFAWGIVTSYSANKYGPYFGDWLPRHEPIGQPFIRHRDGAVVKPGS